MDKDNLSEPNYWKILAAAEKALAEGDFARGETLFHEASGRRDSSPGRVFFSEKLTDGIKGLFRQTPGGKEKEADSPGRWTRRVSDFRRDFLSQGEHVVREGVRVADLRPEDDPVTNQPVLEAALFLVARSRLFQEEPSSAVPLLKGLFRTACRTGRPFDFHLVRHDLPLTEEDRLWLARKGGELFDSFMEHERLVSGSDEAGDWAHVVLQLLQPMYFGSTSRLEEERSWLEAVTTDRLLGQAGASVDLYRAYLGMGLAPGARTDEARVRLLELLGNTDEGHFPVPRYEEALATLSFDGLPPAGNLATRFQSARDRLAFRRPAAGPSGQPLAWASSAADAQGRFTFVYWWDNEPRDVASWMPGDAPGPLEEFLAPCEGRLVVFDESARTVAASAWPGVPAPWMAREFMGALMEDRLPAAGLDRATVLGLCLAETGPWRGGWDFATGHPGLEPPRSSSLLEAWEDGPTAGALMAGLSWLAVRNRVADGDPTLRAGIGELARRGDPASRFLYEFLNMDSHGGPGLDDSFQAWTLPLLWTRPDPFGWSAVTPSPRDHPAALDPGLRPDLGRNDLAIVSTGDPTSVLAAWGDGRQKWRVVLDRLDRLEALAQVAGGVIGPVTLIPATGTVHCLAEALDFLEVLLTEVRPEQDSLLAIFHWLRLVQTHNGDLLDFRQVRPRQEGKFPLYDRYAEVVGALPREEPRIDPEGHLDTWAGQFSQRVRKAGLVAGPVDHLVVTPEKLDGLWGVFEGSDASWVFLDSAAIHWTLLRRGGMGVEEIHAVLHSRGRRHLSLLTGAVWLRSELESLLAGWLGVFGTPYCLALTDSRPPALRLADRGVQPEARLLACESLASQTTWVDKAFREAGGGHVQLPAAGRSASYWSAVSRGEIACGGPDWKYLLPEGEGKPAVLDQGGLLVIPSLASLEMETMPVAKSGTRADWVRADNERATFFAWRRKICALEIAAGLAGPWDTVAVLDTRWWRLFFSGEVRGSLSGAGSQSLGSEAVRLATEDAGRALDLPGSEARGRHSVDGKIQALVNGWLMTHDPAALAGGRQDEDPSRGTGKEPARGVSLLIGDASASWRGLSNRIAEAWERGRVDSWILLVADRIPEGAERLVAVSAMAGISVWSGAASHPVPAPVVWVDPEDFGDPDLIDFLAAYPPTAILAGDVADWKPGPEREAQETALALRSILDCRAETVLLHSDGVADSWIRFLASACGAKVVAGSGVPTVSVHPEAEAQAACHCLDCGRVWNATSLTRRLRVLFPRLRSLTTSWPGMSDGGEPDSSVPGRQLLSLEWLGNLAGLSADDVADGVRLLRWAARLAGDSLSAAGTEFDTDDRLGHGHTLLIPRRFAELEKDLEQLERNLGVMLPLWLGRGRPGFLNWIDMEYPPALVDDRELALLDCFLMWNGSRPGSMEDEPASDDSGLTYMCPRGLIHSTQRLVGCRQTSADVLQELVHRLKIFRARVEDIMSGALETGEGFLVETGLTDLRSEERSFMGLGAALGFWRWLGPPCRGAVHLVDLLTVAESRTARQASHGWELVRAEAGLRYPGTGGAGIGAGALTAPGPESGRGRRSLRALFAGGAEKRDDLDPIVSRAAELVTGGGDASLLVLKGVFGSGRHEAVGRGLLKAGVISGEIPELTVYCPDEAVAAMVCREFLRLGLPSPLDVRVPSGDAGRLETRSSSVGAADPSGALVVICEAQRFDPETRYRIAQTGRGRRLIMTVDPAAATEPWEHLFLTTPRSNDILEMPGQRRATKKLWSEVRRLVPSEYQDGRVHRREKGNLISDYAANLDQCLSRVTLEYEGGKLLPPLRITAPMPGDLEYLGSSMRDRGWLAVLETRLEALLLPGPREFLAAVTDHLALSGQLVDDFAPEPVPAHPDLLTPRLLGAQGSEAWRQWVAGLDTSAELTLNGFADLVAPTAWANTFLARPAARARILRLLEQYGEEPLGALMALPLWEAWWYTMLDDLAADGPRNRRPLAVLTSAARPLGGAMPGAAYLCLGTEPVRQHYESLIRVTDSLLVLYQEKSPLISETGD